MSNLKHQLLPYIVCPAMLVYFMFWAGGYEPVRDVQSVMLILFILMASFGGLYLWIGVMDDKQAKEKEREERNKQ